MTWCLQYVQSVFSSARRVGDGIFRGKVFTFATFAHLQPSLGGRSADRVNSVLKLRSDKSGHKGADKLEHKVRKALSQITSRHFLDHFRASSPWCFKTLDIFLLLTMVDALSQLKSPNAIVVKFGCNGASRLSVHKETTTFLDHCCYSVKLCFEWAFYFIYNLK